MVRRRKEQISFRRFSFPIPTNPPTPSRPMMAMAPQQLYPPKEMKCTPKVFGLTFEVHFIF